MAAGTSYRAPGTLPPQASGFVGREAELARARELLRQSRLVTVTGTGGVGKTRLAVRVAGEAADGFRDGAHLVELSGGARSRAARVRARGRAYARRARPTPRPTRDPSSTRCSASSATASCCSSSIPASTSSTRARRLRAPSSARRQASPSWRRAGSRLTPRARPSCSSARCRCRTRATTRRARRTPSSCSRSGPRRRCLVSA